MVFRFRSRNNLRLRPINRIKHVVDFQDGVSLNAQTTKVLIKAVDNPVVTNATEVKTGSTVNGIYLKVEGYITSSGALANGYILVAKNPGGNLNFPNANAVGTNDNKRFVIHQEMVMFQKVTNSNPRTIFNGVIAIPRGYRRFGPNDTLLLQYFSPGVNLDVCLQCHYKEFR